jgi:hypothetical protein
MPTVSKILCPETQYDEDTLIDNPPHKAPICLDFSLYVKSVNIPDFPHAKSVGQSSRQPVNLA